MAKKHFIFTDKVHPPKAIFSTVLGIISLGATCLMVFFSYLQGGEAPAASCLVVLLAFVYAWIGIYLGASNVKEAFNYRFFAWLGLFLNACTLLAVAALVYVGLGYTFYGA